jgi:hypothetical protein
MTTTPDVWDAEDCGLLVGPVGKLLGDVHTVTDGPRAPDGASTYMAGQPQYQPYRSASMPCPEDGLKMAEHVMRTIHSPELRASVQASPLADVAHRTTTTIANTLWRADASPAARGLARIAEVAPRKGGEMRELWQEYSRRIPGATDPIMAMRDLWGSAYVWQFIRGEDARIHDLCGSLLSLTSAVDYCDASDDSGAGGHRVYMTAASEGLAYLSGPVASQAVRDVVAVGGMMAVKDAMAGVGADPVTDAGPVTPAEYVRARAWDGAVAPYYRLMLSTTHYQHLSDERGAFRSASSCQVLKRATDNVMRYNDITDAVADYSHHESFNELLLALALRGHSAVRGFGSALGELTDAVLECRCGEPGHEEAAEMSMGTCMWYLLIPRYNVRQQLRAYTRAGGELAHAYALPDPGSRSAGCTLLPGDNLYADDWTPLWQPVTRTADERGHRLARRALPPGADTAKCAAVATSLLATTDRAADLAALREAGTAWQRLFRTVLEETGSAGVEHADVLHELVNEVWQQTVLGERSGAGVDSKLLMDVDEAARETFTLPAEHGTPVRRAFFGVISGSVELAGLNPYVRLADGLATMCA